MVDLVSKNDNMEFCIGISGQPIVLSSFSFFSFNSKSYFLFIVWYQLSQILCQQSAQVFQSCTNLIYIAFLLSYRSVIITVHTDESKLSFLHAFSDTLRRYQCFSKIFHSMDIYLAYLTHI